MGGQAKVSDFAATEVRRCWLLVDDADGRAAGGKKVHCSEILAGGGS